MGVSSVLQRCHRWVLLPGFVAQATIAQRPSVLELPPVSTGHVVPTPSHRLAMLPADSIEVTRPAPGIWRVTYRFDDPAPALRFGRAAAFHRERVWRIVTPGYVWDRDSTGQDVVQLLRAIGPAARTIVVEFPEYAEVLPKEYELFLRFSDGSVALYTGHLYAAPDTGRDLLRSVRIVSPPGASVLVAGHRADTSVSFLDEAGDGAYAYIGSLPALETSEGFAVVDPGLPPWLRTLFETRVPGIFTLYRDEFNVPLPRKPIILVGYREGVRSGRTSSGGTLPGQVTLAFEGAAWRTESADARRQAFHLLAHEFAHLWNGHLVANAGGPASWMHEGSADALAAEALLVLGVVDSIQSSADRDAVLNACLSALVSGSVHSAEARGAFRQFYDCGAVLSDWTVAALRQSDPSADVFTFWRALLTRTLDSGRYTEEDWFTVLAVAGVPSTTIDAMRTFLDAPGLAGALQAIAASGISMHPAPAPPLAQQGYARAAFAHLMAVTCGGRLSYSWGPVVVTGALVNCAPFATPMRVAFINRHRLGDEGTAAHDAVLRACSSGEMVDLGGEDGSTLRRVPCTTPLAPRVPWYSWNARRP
jgi:hypothetical protein